MQFERNLYVEGLHVLLRTLPYAALAIVGEFAVQVAKEVTNIGSGLFFASILIWSFLAFAAHAEILLPPGRDKHEDQKRIFGFAMRTFGLFVLIGAPMLAVVLIAAFPMNQDFTQDETLGVIILVALVTVSLMAILVFGLLGTVLPAHVADEGRGVRAALSRGPTQFWYIAGQLVVGPGIILAISLTPHWSPISFSRRMRT